jgi:hypothetical protein
MISIYVLIFGVDFVRYTLSLITYRPFRAAMRVVYGAIAPARNGFSRILTFATVFALGAAMIEHHSFALSFLGLIGRIPYVGPAISFTSTLFTGFDITQFSTSMLTSLLLPAASYA